MLLDGGGKSGNRPGGGLGGLVEGVMVVWIDGRRNAKKCRLRDCGLPQQQDSNRNGEEGRRCDLVFPKGSMQG